MTGRGEFERELSRMERHIRMLWVGANRPDATRPNVLARCFIAVGHFIKWIASFGSKHRD